MTQRAISGLTAGPRGYLPAGLPASNRRRKSRISTRLWDEFSQYPSDSAEAAELGAAYFAYWGEELPIIPSVGLTPQPVIYSNRLRNVPTEGLFWGSDTNFYAPFHIEQWYIDDMLGPRLRSSNPFPQLREGGCRLNRLIKASLPSYGLIPRRVSRCRAINEF